jgi:hypothetical protein
MAHRSEKDFPLPPISEAVKAAIYKRSGRVRGSRHPYNITAEDVLHITRKTFNKMMRCGRFDFTEDLVPLVEWTQSMGLIEVISLELTRVLTRQKQNGG